MKIQKLLIVIFLLISHWSIAQNSRFSQVGSAPMLINPSLTGRFDGKMRLGALYSWQESNITSMQHQNVFLAQLARTRALGGARHACGGDLLKNGRDHAASLLA